MNLSRLEAPNGPEHNNKCCCGGYREQKAAIICEAVGMCCIDGVVPPFYMEVLVSLRVELRGVYQPNCLMVSFGCSGGLIVSRRFLS